MKISEASQELGISKSTLLRWFYTGKIPEVKRDRNGNRIFTEQDIDTIKKYRDQEQEVE